MEAGEMISMVMEGRNLRPAPGLYLIVGPYEIQGRLLYSLTDYLAQGRAVHWIDAGNWIDAYGLAKAAQARRLDPRAVLRQIRVARPFTAIQLTAMLEKKVSSLPPRSPVIVADPMALFYDPQMPEKDTARVWRNFMDAVKGLSSPILTLAVQRDPPPARADFSRQLMKEAKDVARVRPKDMFPRLGRAPAPRQVE